MIRELEHKDKALYLTLLANFSLMGGVVTLFGAAVAKVIDTYGWSYTDAGTIYAAASIGFFTSSIVAGFLIDHFGSKRIVMIGLTAEALSLMFFARTPNLTVNVVLYFIIGLGLGSNEVITNSIVVRLEERGKSRLMNLIHASWCLGAVIGPLGVANLIRTGSRWQIVFPVFGALILLLAGLLVLQRFPKPAVGLGSDGSAASLRWELGASEGPGRANGRGRALRGGMWAALKSRSGSFVLLCAITIFVYIGVEKGIYGWVAEFFVKVLGSSIPLGAAMVALYWTGQLLGRLGISVVYRGSRLEVVLLLLSLLSVASLMALAFVRITWIAVVCTFVAGVANSGIFPLIISLTGKYSMRGRSVGIVTAAGGMAGFLFPIAVAFVSDAMGIARGFETVFFIGVVMLLISFVVAARVRRLDREEVSGDGAEARIA